jgi:hypothetical protein
MDCFAEPVIGRAFARPVGSQLTLSPAALEAPAFGEVATASMAVDACGIRCERRCRVGVLAYAWISLILPPPWRPDD